MDTERAFEMLEQALRRGTQLNDLTTLEALKAEHTRVIEDRRAWMNRALYEESAKQALVTRFRELRDSVSNVLWAHGEKP